MVVSEEKDDAVNRASAVTLAGRLIVLVALATMAGACALLGASSGAPARPLAVPEAPPRAVAEFPNEIPFQEEPPIEESPLEKDPLVGREVEPPITRPPVAQAPEPVVEQAPEAVLAPPQLTPAPGLDVDAETVQRGLRITARLLEGIDRTELDIAGRAQHDTARRFHHQATAAMQAGNVMFAHYLNEKADTLVRDLEIQ